MTEQRAGVCDKASFMPLCDQLDLTLELLHKVGKRRRGDFGSRRCQSSLGELLGISQSERQVSRRYHLRILIDPFAPLDNARRRAGLHCPPMRLARFLRRLFR